MKIKRIAQPYVVEIQWNEAKEQVMLHWLTDNITNYFVIAWIVKGGWIVPQRHDNPGQSEVIDGEQICLFQFECPKDALLFKLAWGGE